MAEEENPSMPKANQVNWQPISQMPLISSMIDTSLNDTREHLGTLSKAKDRPYVLETYPDMRRLSAAQVALALRRMADRIESVDGGLAVYKRPAPRWDTAHAGGNWMAIERADGSFDHSIE
jgi:hypothetical protein